MKRVGILNENISRVVASMGHGDMLAVCDAGFPIPKGTEIGVYPIFWVNSKIFSIIQSYFKEKDPFR